MSWVRPEEREILSLLESNTDDVTGKTAARVFDEAVDRLVDLWVENREKQRAWPSGFQEQVAALLRREGNRLGFQAYLNECEIYALRSKQDGFHRSCYYRSHIQVLIDESVPFADLVHPDDTDSLDDIDAIYVNDADDIVPVPPEDIPSWIPESHWWWRAPTNHNMSQREIHEKLYDYHPEDWDNR